MFLLGSYIWMSSGTQLKSVVLQSCILSSSHSTHAALTILLLFFRVSLSIHPRLVILFQKSKKPQKWQYRLLNSTFVLVTDCQGNLHPHSVCCFLCPGHTPLHEGNSLIFITIYQQISGGHWGWVRIDPLGLSQLCMTLQQYLSDYVCGIL